MATTLLTTKFHIPPLASSSVARPRLVRCLQSGLNSRLTLVCAPAGYGKTTLISEWIASGGGKAPSFDLAWLSLDDADNDPVRFLVYLTTALSRSGSGDGAIGAGALRMLHSPQPTPSETVLTTIINDCERIRNDLVLVLDDYHLIESTAVHQAVAFLLDNLPPKLHLIIASRDDPHLPLARLRAQGQMSEVRAADLRFSLSEAAEYLNSAMGLDLSQRAIGALEERTEGWIAGLHLAALSMQRMGEPSALIKSFTGSHRYVLDYLIEEVLAHQPSGVRDFLLQTSILRRMSGALCDAVTGNRDGQETLVALDRANLFIVPLDEERQWYRYHHLFADLLQRRLHQTRADAVPQFHRRASGWYEQHGVPSEAIRHALRSEDHAWAADLIEKHADLAWESGQHARLAGWLAQLPESLIFNRPLLCIYHSWYQFISGQTE